MGGGVGAGRGSRRGEGWVRVGMRGLKMWGENAFRY